MFEHLKPGITRPIGHFHATNAIKPARTEVQLRQLAKSRQLEHKNGSRPKGSTSGAYVQPYNQRWPRRRERAVLLSSGTVICLRLLFGFAYTP